MKKNEKNYENKTTLVFHWEIFKVYREKRRKRNQAIPLSLSIVIFGD